MTSTHETSGASTTQPPRLECRPEHRPLAQLSGKMLCSIHTATPSTMLVTLDPRDERPLYLQIMDQVRRALVVGTLRAGDPLPSVRELAGQLVVNPRTVSQAYRELEREGVIYVRRGQGTFVAPTIHPDRRERRALVRAVAERALVDARRNGLGVEELVVMIWEVAGKDDAEATSTSAVSPGEEEGAA